MPGAPGTREAATGIEGAAGLAHPSVAVDICVFSIAGGALTVHLAPCPPGPRDRRALPPGDGPEGARAPPPRAGGPFALPGGFVRLDESVDGAARRVLREEAGLARGYLEQLYTFGDVKRDPRARVISVAYYALVGQRTETVPAALHPFKVSQLPPLILDHRRIVDAAVTRVRGKLLWTPIAFELMPREFTLTELQRAYEMILGRTLAKAAFRRRILAAALVRPTRKMRRGGHRPAVLYRFVEGTRT